MLMTNWVLQSGHTLKLLRGGADFFPALVAAIDASLTEVRLETYIFHFDASGQQVAHALVRAAKRSVAVYLVMDGIGTPEVPAVWAERFAATGVRWHRFSPLDKLGLLVPMRWRRLHRKLCVVDAQVAFCGGINVLDDWLDPNHGSLNSPRFDFAVQIGGPLVANIQQTTAQFWNRLQVTRQLEHMQLSAARDTLMQTIQPSEIPLTVMADANTGACEGAMAALVLRDNVRNRTRIEKAYRKAIGDAHREVLIANAYFLPGGKLRRAIIHAAHRGVKVRLLLQGRYEYFMQFHAARPVLGALIAAGVEIHEYADGFLHAKVAVVDGRWATVGSSNLDPLSLLLAREANIVVEDVAFASELRTTLMTAIESQSLRLDTAVYASRPWLQRCLDQLAYALMRLGLFLTGRRY